jgi:predicted enzyme related to lactoylglutathione lyase
MAKAKKKSATKAKAKKPVKKKAAATKRAAAPKRAAHPAVVHWEVQARDLPRQQQFFSNLFGWKIDTNNPMQYGMISGAGKDTIGGGIGPAMDQSSRVTFYIQVPDINQTLDKAQGLGAQTVLPRTAYGPVIMGLFRDLEGNVIGLVEG